jgi:hypothetical protein
MTIAERDSDFQAGLDAFVREIASQVDAAGLGSEHAVHFCLALGFQAAYGLQPGSIVFEKPIPGGRADPLDWHEKTLARLHEG